MLEIQNLSVTFGNVQAVDDFSMQVKKGEIIAISGHNGAGKSSVLNAITGIIRPIKGSILFKGDEVAHQSSHKIVRKGIIQIPEGRRIFNNLSVRENLLVGAYRSLPLILNDQEIAKIIHQFPTLLQKLNANASTLSGGQAQLLALARGLMAKPILLLLDEPTLGLSPIVAEEIFRLIKGLKEEGTTILVVEQNIQKVLTISDRVYIFENGKVVAEGLANKIAQSTQIMGSFNPLHNNNL